MSPGNRPHPARLAVLIDADNARSSFVPALLSEVAKHGTASVKRAYGDWTQPNLNGWKEVLNAHAIGPIQQFRYTHGKNATDSALIIDAMDLLHAAALDGFCLVSSDSDFTRLATRLRESGVTVFGFGEQKTPSPFVHACDEFVYLEQLGNEKQPAAKCPAATVPPQRTAQKLQQDKKLVQLLKEAVKAAANKEGWAEPSQIAKHVKLKDPDFNPRQYQCSGLLKLLQATKQFEVAKPNKPAHAQPLVRVKE
jgi:uncharacterized LabA/DUF88 family protein